MKGNFFRIRLAILAELSLLLSINASVHAQSGSSRAPVDEAQLAQNGNYYAMVIGINNYSPPLPKLATAVADARAIAQVLSDSYGFQVKLLIDQDATRLNILKALAQYRNKLNENDNLLIYYAGHGISDPRADKAYWIPVDADSVDSPNRIIADEITTDVRVQSARHVLIISDSCYSGGLTRDADAPGQSAGQRAFLNRMLTSRSRTLMASGGDEPVSDGGPDGHSVFAYAVLHSLQQTSEPVFTASDLFYGSVRQQVAGRSSQLPQYSIIRNSSHDDGDFVFTRKVGPASAGTLNVSAGSEIWTKGKAMADANRAAEALALFRQSCDASEARGCTSLGMAFREGSGTAKNLPESARLFRLACDDGDLKGCALLGYAYQQGLGVPKDLTQSIKLFFQSCDAQHSNGCSFLADAYVRGLGVEKDIPRAVKLFRQACDVRNLPACSNLGYAYQNGFGVDKDPARAIELFRQACDGKEVGGCRHLGFAYANGLGVEADPAQAAKLYQQACDGGDAVGCTNLGFLYDDGTGVKKDSAAAAKFFRLGCDRDHADGCYKLALAYRAGLGVEKDSAQAGKLFSKSCSLGNSNACSETKPN
jgi:TPR repeat protein